MRASVCARTLDYVTFVFIDEVFGVCVTWYVVRFFNVFCLNSCCNVPRANILMYGQAQYKYTLLLLLFIQRN